MKTKILIAILTVGVFTVGVFSISAMKAQEKPMKVNQDTMKMIDRSLEVEIKHELMEIDSMYTCPMHADVKSDKPGACPKCGMDLQKMGNAKNHQCCGGMKMECGSAKMGMDHSKMEMRHDSAKMKMNNSKLTKTFVCPMHPDQVSNNPGECPKCGMALQMTKSPVKQQ
jgi:hypothetical protein